MPRPKGYGRALRAASDAARQERMVVGESSDGRSKGEPKKRAKPGRNARKKAQRQATGAPKTPAASKTLTTRQKSPTVSDWSQTMSLFVHRCDPETRASLRRLASALAVEMKSPQRREVLDELVAAAAAADARER